MRASALGLTVLMSISVVSAIHASQPGSPRRMVGAGVNSNHAGETAGAAQVPPRVIFSCQSTFAIPFTVDLTGGNSQEVLLFLSTDYGRTWGLCGRQPSAQARFVFRATGDGNYWFASRTTAAGTPAPTGVSFKPELSVIVDTTDPRLNLQATVDPGGEIKIVWDAFDQHLSPDPVKLEYQSGLTTPWRPIPIQAADDGVLRTNVRGQMSWRPDKADRIVSIRAIARDKAENAGEMTRRLIIPPLTFAARDPSQGTMVASSVPRDPFAQYGVASDTPQEHQQTLDRIDMMRERGNGTVRENGMTRERENDTPRERENGMVREENKEHRTAAGHPQAEGVAWPTDNQQNAISQWRNDYPPSKSSVGPPVTRRVPTGQDTSMEARNGGPDITRDTGDNQTGSLAGLPQGERPHMTRSKRFNLDYSIDAAGPQGVEKVELWVTRNSGRDWDLWGVDEDRESPFLVSVDNEGTYGFRVVIVGRNGLASETPAAGDLADLWVGIDTTKPVADIASAAYGSGAFAGHLDVRWTVAEDHLGAKPITLLISEKRNGPWTPIASGLPNTGQHYWRVDSRVPDRFYLRLEVRDEAGNVTHCELDTPIRSAGLTPKGHVRGFEPAER